MLELIDQVVYTPPNVARGGCHIFDQNTGTKCHIKKCGYYSAYGGLLKG
jgi:cysteine dioxygenase